MLRLLNLITLTSLFVAPSPCIAFGQYAFKSDRLQTNSVLVAAELEGATSRIKANQEKGFNSQISF